MAYEQETYEAIMRRILGRVEANIDKREGSMIWNSSGPAAVEIAILYTALDFILKATFADTAPREYLIRRAAERGISPKAATKAQLLAEFDIGVPIGSRFSLGALNYEAIEYLPERNGPGVYACRMECETPGAVGNSLFGALIPTEYIDGLTHAEITELLIPGADDEDTEVFRARYFASLSSQAFGGNRADYREKVLALPGVGAVKVIPAWNSGVSPASLIPPPKVQSWLEGGVDSLPPEVAGWLKKVYTAAAGCMLTVGGVVKLVIMSSAYTQPTQELIAQVQTAVDPPGSQGEGIGIAPIGHVVSVQGVESCEINLALTLQYEAGWSWQAAESYINEAVDSYFYELAESWQEADGIVVRISQIETRILSCPGVLDVQGTLLNGSAENLTLSPLQIPIRGAVSG